MGLGRYLAGQSLLPCEGLRGPGAGQSGRALVEERPINRTLEAVPVLLFLLLLHFRLPSLYWPLFLFLLPGFPRRLPAFLGAEAVGAAPWRPPVSLATGPLLPRGSLGAQAWREGGGCGPVVLSRDVGRFLVAVGTSGMRLQRQKQTKKPHKMVIAEGGEGMQKEGGDGLALS